MKWGFLFSDLPLWGWLLCLTADTHTTQFLFCYVTYPPLDLIQERNSTICDSWGNSGSHQQSENFLFRDHRKCIDSVHLSVLWKQLQSRLQSLAESCALSWAYRWVCSPLSQDIYLKRCRSRAVKIIKDSNHPGNCLFTLLPSGKRFRSLMAKTERLRSFFLQAIRLLNSNSAS